MSPRPVVTAPTPVEDLLRPAAPSSPFTAPASPFASASPFAARSPFTPASPFSGGGGGRGLPPKSPWAAAGSPWEKRPKRYGKDMTVVRRVFIPARRRVARMIGDRWVVPVFTIEQVYEQDAKTFGSGDGLDFDEAALQSADTDHANDYCPYTGDDEIPHEVDESGYPTCRHPICAEHMGADELTYEAGMTLEMQEDRNYGCREIWPELRPLLVARRHEVFADPERFLFRKDAAYAMLAHRVLQDADVDLGEADFGGFGFSSDALGNQLLRNIEAPFVLDALADAVIFGDAQHWSFQAWTSSDPDVPTTEYEKALLHAHGRDLQLDVIPASWMQFLIFAETGSDCDAVEGRHLVTGTSYHSFLAKDTETPVGILGWREIVMQPCDDQWNLIS